MIRYTTGDATSPKGTGNKIIAHICNDIGAFGKGFVLAIDKKWKAPKTMYKGWYNGARRIDVDPKFGLGEIQIVKVADDIWVANMVAQHGIYKKNNIPPIRYDAVEQCLNKLSEKAIEMSASVHMPRIGCGLAGGQWNKVEDIINNTLIKNNIMTIVYDFKGK